MDLQPNLSGLSRGDLLQLIAAQQTQLQSRAQVQQLQQERQQNLAWLERQQQQQQQQMGLSGATTASSFLNDYDRALTGAGSDNGALAAALMRTAGTASGSFHSTTTSASDLLRRSEASAAGSSLTTSDLELLQARARLNAASSAAAAAVDPYAAAMRSIMLRKELLSSGGRSASDLFSGYEIPNQSSTELDVLRRLVVNAEQERACFAAASSGVDSHLFDSLANRNLTSNLLQTSSIPGAVNPHRMDGLTNTESMFHQARALGNLSAANQQSMTAAAAVKEKPVSAPLPAAAPVAARGAGGKVRGTKKTKRPLSAYNIYFKEEHAKIIAQQQKERAEKEARGEHISSEDEYEDDPDAPEGESRKRKRSLSTNQPGKRGKRQVDFENLTKAIGKRWKDLPSEVVDAYKRRAEEAMQAYRKNLFQKIRKSVKDDQTS